MLHIFALLLGCSDEPDTTPVYSEEDNKPDLLGRSSQSADMLGCEAQTSHQCQHRQYTIVLPKRTNKDIFISPLNQPQQDMIKVLKMYSNNTPYKETTLGYGTRLDGAGATEKTVTGKSVMTPSLNMPNWKTSMANPSPSFQESTNRPTEPFRLNRTKT